MKTATIGAHHVFGTRSTSCAYIAYRDEIIWEVLENNSEDELFARAMRVAAQMGFTHYTLGFKKHKLEPAKHKYRNCKGEELMDPETYMIKTGEVVKVSRAGAIWWRVDQILNGEPCLQGGKVYA